MKPFCPFMSGALKKVTTNDTGHHTPSTHYEPFMVECTEESCKAWQKPYDTPKLNYCGSNGTFHQPSYHHEGYCKIIDPKGVAFKPSDIVTVGARGLDDPLYGDTTVGAGGTGITSPPMNNPPTNVYPQDLRGRRP